MYTPWVSVAMIIVASIIGVASVVLAYAKGVSPNARARLRTIFNRIIGLLAFMALDWLYIRLHGLLADVQTSAQLSPDEPVKNLSAHAADVLSTDHTVRTIIIVIILSGACVQFLAPRRAERQEGENAA